MTDTVKLLFGVHAHQPAGNFPEVVRLAHHKCYGPFLEVLERHPEFPFSIHISGWLMEFLAREFPGDFARLRGMVDRGQVEVFGGGDTEPVLAAVVDADRRAQIAALNRRIRRRLGVRPAGAWLTERVWEAMVVPALADSGIRYVAVDDYHFLCAGQPPERLNGYFSTEENGFRLDLFPISEALRYKFPFAPVADAIGFLEHTAPGGAAIYFDDIEKFGIWPETHDWVYGRRWLEDFIEAVRDSPKIEPLRYADYHASHGSRGVVYLPAVSYIEMGEWTLPPRSAGRFGQLVERAKREGTFAEDKVFLRGGHWRNFFSLYPESNWMHKRMIGASRRYHALDAVAKTPAMRTNLHLAQANDAYWHGLFGGLYLPHLRRQVFTALARLERAMDAVASRKRVEILDLDLDGHDEIFLWSPKLLAVIKPEAGASLCELTHYGLAHNFADALARRVEHYHEAIRARLKPGGASDDGGIASIHGRVAYRTPVSESDLIFDRNPRSLFLDSWQQAGGVSQVCSYETLPVKRGVARFAGHSGALSIEKSIQVEADELAVAYALTAASDERGTFSVEFNIAMPSCDGPGGAYRIDDKALGRFGERLAVERADSLTLADTELHGSIRLEFSTPAVLTTEPLETVSQSETGFEKIMQAATVRAAWPVGLRTGETAKIAVRVSISAL